MRLTKIQIYMMAKFETFDIDLPAVALIQGKNEEGKTSFLDCIKYAFGRGHDEDMIHAGAAEGTIIITLDDDSQIKCRANRAQNKTERSYRSPGKRKFLVSREAIDALANAISYDPLKLMEMSDKEQIETILKVTPVELDPAEMEAAVGEAAPEAEAAIPRISRSMNAFDVIRLVHGSIYDQRTVLNVAADTQTKHAGELESAVGSDGDGEDWTAIAKMHADEKAISEKELDNRIATINEGLVKFKEAHTAALEVRISELRKELDVFIEKERMSCAEVAAAAREEYGVLIQQSTADLATANERAKQQRQAQGTRMAAKIARDEASAKTTRSKVLSEALVRLDALKSTVASRLNLGIEIADGRIWNEEKVPFARWNTESQMRFCLKLGVRAHGKAGFICIDGAERFDKEKRAALVRTATKYAESDGLQFMIAAISEGSFEVLDASSEEPKS